MQLRQAIATAVVALLLATPAVSATWRHYGSFEPDTPQDATGTYMFADPDWGTGPAQVYFNVVISPSWSGQNPNLGATESRIITAGFQNPSAFIGVWKDCNKDGYIGHIETLFMEYRSELLSDTSVCPDGSDFNRDGWVYEFRWIADGNLHEQRNQLPRFVNDTSVMIWGDNGLAGVGDVPGSCFVNFPTGTFSSTGAVLDWADCLTGHTVAHSVNCATVGGVNPIDETLPCPALDPGNELGLAFPDPENPQCGQSALNQPLDLFSQSPECPSGRTGKLEENGDAQPAFTVFDCSAPGTRVGDDDNHVYVPGRADPKTTHAQDGSWFEGANHTVRAIESDCEPQGNTLANGLYNDLEDPVSQTQVKRDTDFYFTWTASARFYRQGNYCGSTVLGNAITPPANTPVTDENGCAAPVLGTLFGMDAPLALGVYRTNQGVAGLGPRYYASVGSTAYAPTVRGEGLGVEPDGPVWYSFYAHTSVGSQGYLLPSTSTGIYGDEYCNGVYTGVVAGFDCDPEHWWDPAWGATVMPRQGGRDLGAVPGSPYNLRDIDCLDGTVSSDFPGVGLGLTWLGDEADNVPCSV